MDIDDAALQAILTSLKEQAGRLQAPVQEHADLGSAMLQLIKFEYVNGMEWGFHYKELCKDIAYGVSHRCWFPPHPLPPLIPPPPFCMQTSPAPSQRHVWFPQLQSLTSPQRVSSLFFRSARGGI